MITIIARKELLEIVRDGRFRWAATSILALLVVSVLAGWTSYRDTARQHKTAQGAMREMWLAQPAKNPHAAAHYGVWVFKPKSSLSFIDHGVDPYVGVAAWLEAHKQNEFRYRPAMDATSVRRFSEWTAATVMQMLIPLLIVVLAFPMFSGERERGTWRQLMSLGVAPRTLMLGKVLGVAGALALVLVPAAGLGTLALALAGDAALELRDLPRLALLVLVYLGYFAIFGALALLVSARAASMRLTLLVLLAVWVVNTLVAPRAVADLARRLHPTPSAFAFLNRVDHELQNGVDGHTPDRRTEELRRAVLARYGTRVVESLPVNFDALALQAGEEFGNAVFDRHYNALYERYRQQHEIHQLAALVVPLLAVRSLSMALTGTDVEHHRAFATAAEQYRRDLVQRMNDDMARHSRTGDRTYEAPTELWATVPPLQYTAPGLGAALASQRWSLAVLALWLAASVGALIGVHRVRLF